MVVSPVRSGASALLGDLFSSHGIWVLRIVAQGQLLGADGNWMDPLPGCSCVLRDAGKFLGTDVVVLPLCTGVSALLGDQRALSGTWVWRAMA